MAFRASSSLEDSVSKAAQHRRLNGACDCEADCEAVSPTFSDSYAAGCDDQWSAAGLPPTKVVQPQGAWTSIFTADELANLKNDVGVKIAMSFEATSTCSQDIELGFSGGGGWLKVTVKKGTHTYAVEDDRKKGPTDARYEIRTAGCEGTITLDLIKYTNCAAQSDNSSNDDGNGSSKGASLAIIIPVVVAAVLLLAAILFLVRKRVVAARQHRRESMPTVGGDEAEAEA